MLWTVNDELRLSFVARQSDGMNEFDSDMDFDGVVDDQDMVSEFRNSTMRVQGDYVSASGRFQQKLVIAQSNNDNEAFDTGVLGTYTSSTKDQYQYTGSVFWNESSQRLSVLAEREEEDFQQRGAINDYGIFGVYDPNQDRKRDTNSIAIEYRGDASDRLSLAASARYDDNSEFDSANTFRVEAVYQLNDGTRLRSAYGTAIKNPTFTERFGFYTNFIGNPNLEPEESASWELGIDQMLFDNSLTLSATLFDTELKNEINGSALDPVTFGYTAINKEGKSQRQGFELTAIGTLSSRLSLNAAYTYTDSVEWDAENAVYIDELRRARHIASLNLAWQAMDSLHINANVQHNGSQTDVVFPNIVDLDSYTLVNLNVNFSATEKLDVYLRLDNLFDEDYEEVFSYQTLGFGASLGVRFSL